MSILKNMMCTYSKVRRGTNGLIILLVLRKVLGMCLEIGIYHQNMLPAFVQMRLGVVFALPV